VAQTFLSVLAILAQTGMSVPPRRDCTLILHYSFLILHW
jgi:hypothetical protein